VQPSQDGSGYAEPVNPSGIGLHAEARLKVSAGETTKWLDEFDDVEATLAPGSAVWTCSDQLLGLSVRLTALPMLEVLGFSALSEVTSDTEKTVTLEWHFDGLDHAEDAPHAVRFATGAKTVFLKLQAGNTTWFHPLDLCVRERWEVVTRLRPADSVDGGTEAEPSVDSPRIDIESRRLVVELRNNQTEPLVGTAKFRSEAWCASVRVELAAGETEAVSVQLGEAWNALSPGTFAFCVELNGEERRAEAVTWELTAEHTEDLAGAQQLVDLEPSCTINKRVLFGPHFLWRMDYTGATAGIQWRHPRPRVDEKGYYIQYSPSSFFSKAIDLPETFCHRYDIYQHEHAHGWEVPISSQLDGFDGSPSGALLRSRWDVPPMPPILRTPGGVQFKLAEGGKETPDILALGNTEPRESLPSAFTLTLAHPTRLVKVYLLTANIMKVLKCYYPGAEVTVRYADGTQQDHQLIPPYSMSSAYHPINPSAQAIQCGKIVDEAHAFERNTFLAVEDVMCDAAKAVTEVEFRCVASETLFGIMGITLLRSQ